MIQLVTSRHYDLIPCYTLTIFAVVYLVTYKLQEVTPILLIRNHFLSLWCGMCIDRTEARVASGSRLTMHIVTVDAAGFTSIYSVISFSFFSFVFLRVVVESTLAMQSMFYVLLYRPSHRNFCQKL